MQAEKINIPNDEIIKAELCKRELWYFVQQFWDCFVPNELIWNWHMRVLCDEIQKVDNRVFQRLPKENDLIINVPPGTSKTNIVSILATAWEFANKPELRIFVGSYSDDSIKDVADKIKIIMKSPKYQSYFPNVAIRRGVDTKHYFKTSLNGEFYGFTVGGPLTSKHADILKVDDPLNPKMAASDVILNTVNNFFSQTLPTRKVDKTVTPTMLIMQRLHHNDPTGFILSRKKEKIRHICLPAEVSPITTPEYVVNYTNGLLDENRLNRETLNEMRIDLGTRGYANQFEQLPTPEGGDIIKSDWFKTIDKKSFDYNRNPLKDAIVFFLDTAFTEKHENDPSGIIATCKIGTNLYILNAVKVWKEFPELCKFLPEFVKANGYSPQSSIRIEPKANGISLIQTMKAVTNLNITNSPSPKDDKKTRITSVAPKIECGRVFLLEGSWNSDFIDEVCGFPNKSHDEFVDNLVEAINYHLSDSTNSQNLTQFFR